MGDFASGVTAGLSLGSFGSAYRQAHSVANRPSVKNGVDGAIFGVGTSSVPQGVRDTTRMALFPFFYGSK